MCLASLRWGYGACPGGHDVGASGRRAAPIWVHRGAPYAAGTEMRLCVSIHLGEKIVPFIPETRFQDVFNGEGLVRVSGADSDLAFFDTQ